MLGITLVKMRMAVALRQRLRHVIVNCVFIDTMPTPG